MIRFRFDRELFKESMETLKSFESPEELIIYLQDYYDHHYKSHYSPDSEKPITIICGSRIFDHREGWNADSYDVAFKDIGFIGNADQPVGEMK